MNKILKNLLDEINKKPVQSLGAIATTVSIIFLVVQNYKISEQTKLMQEQTVSMQEQLKYTQYIDRIQFVHSILTDVFGKDASLLQSKFKNNEIINQDKLIDFIDNFEYVFELYKRHGLIQEGELDVYFKNYLVNSCSSNQVINLLKDLEKNSNSKHRGYKQLCCRYVSGIKNGNKKFYECEQYSNNGK